MLQIPGFHFLTFSANNVNDVAARSALTCYQESGTAECSIAIPEIQPTRSGGYRFLGWADSSNATSASYWANEAISLNDSKTLYAVWAPIYTISFDSNNGTDAIKTQTCYPTTTTTDPCSITIPEIQPTRSGGYRFLGWAESPNAASASYWVNETISLNDSKTLYAVWAKITNNTSDATIDITTKNSFNVTSNKACKALWTGDDDTTWNNLNPNPVAGNDDMRKFNINASQLGNTEIVVSYIGDANSDKALNIRDARKIVNAIMNKDSLSNIERILADVNNDGSVNIRDARIIINNIMGKANIVW
jgi:hypothetical protein